MEYQEQLLSNLRRVNADYHQVGWYQSTFLNTHLTRELMDDHFKYQGPIEESVVIIYGEFDRLFERQNKERRFERKSERIFHVEVRYNS